MESWLGFLTLLLGLVDKIWGAFSKTPSEKITKKKEELREKMDKFKKMKRPE